MDLENEIRTRMARYEALREQIQRTARQMDLLDNLAGEKERARSTLQAVADGKQGDEVLLPLGGDAFLPVTLAGTDKIIKGIGANLATERTIQQAIEDLAKEVETVEEQLRRVAERSNQLQSEAARVQQEMEEMASQMDQSSPGEA